MEHAFERWRRAYEPLYGEHATRPVFEAHCRRARELIAAGAPALDPFDGELPRDGSGVPPSTAVRSARRALGEFQTPDWLADLVLDRAGYCGQGSLVDPACGDGVFLRRALARYPEADVSGFDISPLAVMAARLHAGERAQQGDSLRAPARRYDFIAGNPPWVNWRRLARPYRDRIAPLWERYGLFAKRGLAARLGGAMDDLSSLFTYVWADQWLAEGGRMAVLLSQTLFQSAGGGEAFRRFELPGGRWICPVRLDEIGGLATFDDAVTRTVIAVFEVSSAPPVFPAPYYRGGERWEARGVGREPGAPWRIARARDAAWMERMAGESPYVARIGAHTGGAAGVYRVMVLARHGDRVHIQNESRAGRAAFPEHEAEVEAELVYPFLRGRDVSRWSARPSGFAIIPHRRDGRPLGDAEMPPGARAYFEHFRARLTARPHYQRHFARSGKPYWSMYDVGPYTFAPHRVVWREQSSRFACAVVEGRAIADAKLIVTACASSAEAHYLAAMLNSAPARAFIEAYVIPVQISTHVLKRLRIAKYDGDDPRHRELAELSESCHAGRDVARNERRIDQIARELWGIFEETAHSVT